MRAPNMLALVLLAVALGGCPTTSTPPPYTVTEARYCLGVGSAYNRVLFVTVAEHPTECVIVSFSAADEVLGEGFAQAVSVPCADVFFDGSWNFGPVSSVLSATALARMEIEMFADHREVTYEVVLTLTDSAGVHGMPPILGTTTERTQGYCRARPPVGP